MRTGVIDRVLAMRELRDRLISVGLPNKAIEQDALGNVCSELQISRQTAHSYDHIISVIDRQEPLLSRNIARKALSGASGE